MVEQLVERFYVKTFTPIAEPEELSSNGALSLIRYSSILAGNLDMTLADGTVDGCLKLITTQGGANVTITCSLVGAFVGFSLGANNKALLLWSSFLSAWLIIDSQGLTKDT